MKFRELFKRKSSSSKREWQKIFYCSNCNREVFLDMKFCDECGGELEWPEEYKHLVEAVKEERGERAQEATISMK
ncbi:MAG: zinc-ribbon domain-containing protein [Candidatus Bathyarchaeia archaeon]